MSDTHELTPGLGGSRATMMSLPDGLAEIIEFYGDPDVDGDFSPDEQWKAHNIMIARLPYPMRLSWRPHDPPIGHVQVHRKCSAAMIGALETFRDAVGRAAIEANAWDRFGGLFHVRLQTGAKHKYSIHSWGAAIDINPHLGAFGEFPTQPTELIEAFEASGASWGGDWPSLNPAWPYDGMHWQFATGY